MVFQVLYRFAYGQNIFSLIDESRGSALASEDYGKESAKPLIKSDSSGGTLTFVGV